LGVRARVSAGVDLRVCLRLVGVGAGAGAGAGAGVGAGFEDGARGWEGEATDQGESAKVRWHPR